MNDGFSCCAKAINAKHPRLTPCSPALVMSFAADQTVFRRRSNSQAIESVAVFQITHICCRTSVDHRYFVVH